MWKNELNDWRSIDLEVYKFCFSQAEKQLIQILHQGEKISNRAYSVLSFIIALMSVSVGILYNSAVKKEGNLLVVIMAVIAALSLGFCLYQMYMLLKPSKLFFNGTEPKKLLIPVYLESSDLKNNETILYLYKSELEDIQNKIDRTREFNKVRLKRFNYCILVLVGLSFSAVLIFSILAVKKYFTV